MQPLLKVTTSCKSGVNSSNTTLKSCIPLPHNSTRCGCHKASTGCSTRCRCKNCCNTYGVRPVKATTRKRCAHEMQVILPNAKKFASDRYEELPDTIWSDFEAIVLNEVTSSLPVYTKAPYFISPGSCTLTSSTSKTRVPPSTRRGGTNFSRPLPRQAVLERHGGLER